MFILRMELGKQVIMMFILLSILALTAAKPLDYEQLAREYAENFPNDDLDNPEYGELIDGDIEIDGDTFEELEIGPLNAITNRNRRWTNGRLYYSLSSAYSARQRSQIQAGVDDLIQRTKVNGRTCIDLRPRTNQRNYVHVEKGSGCSSYLGMLGGRQSLSLANGCFSHGTIMHEFLHAFGFHHEQKRTDRDRHVRIDFSNIRPNTERNFQKLPSSQIDLLGTRYDYGSVMHYGAYAFAVDRNKPTIIPTRSGVTIGQRSRLSSMDIERVQIFYGCKSAADSVYFKHLADEDLQ